MHPFEYASPTTLKDALALLGSAWNEADVLAGGTDLLSLLKDGLHTPKRVVNVKGLKELQGIAATSAGLRIGAAVTIDELMAAPALRTAYPSLLEAARGITSPQIRNMGTVGGDLCQRPRCWYYRQGFGLLARKDGKSLVENGENRYHAIFGSGPARFVSASSFAPALIALGAKVKLASPSGVRELPVAEFFVSPASEDEREIALKPNEILTEILVPAAAPKRHLRGSPQRSPRLARRHRLRRPHHEGNHRRKGDDRPRPRRAYPRDRLRRRLGPQRPAVEHRDRRHQQRLALGGATLGTASALGKAEGATAVMA